MKKFIYFFTIFLNYFILYIFIHILHFSLLKLFKTITSRSFSFVAFL